MNSQAKSIREKTALILRRSRMRSGLSREEVAKAVESLSVTELERIENAEVPVECSTVYKLLCEVYSSTREEFLYFCALETARPTEIHHQARPRLRLLSSTQKPSKPDGVSLGA